MLSNDTPPIMPPDPGPGWGERVVGMGAVTAFAGLVTWFTAYAGEDDWQQIQAGITIAGFGVTWVILGYILQTLARQRPPE